jgi:hypothetical protein
MTQCEYEGRDYEFGEPSPMPALIIGQWYRRMVATGAAHQIVSAHYLGISTVATMRCGFSCYVSSVGLVKRNPRTRVCRRCARG